MSDPSTSPAAQQNVPAVAAAAPTFADEYDMLRHAGIMRTPPRGGPNLAQHSPDTAATATNTPETNNTDTNSLPSPTAPQNHLPAPAAPTNELANDNSNTQPPVAQAMSVLQPTAYAYELTTQWQMPRNPKYEGSLRAFMTFVHRLQPPGTTYPKDTTFTREQLLQIKPQHLRDFLSFKAFPDAAPARMKNKYRRNVKNHVWDKQEFKDLSGDGDGGEGGADVGTHSMRKMPATYAVNLGCSWDWVEIRGRWKGRRGSKIVDRYIDAGLLQSQQSAMQNFLFW